MGLTDETKPVSFSRSWEGHGPLFTVCYTWMVTYEHNPVMHHHEYQKLFRGQITNCEGTFDAHCVLFPLWDPTVSNKHSAKS